MTKYPISKLLLIPNLIVLLAHIVTCIQPYKERNNRYIAKTDGKILCLIRASSSLFPSIQLKLFKYLINYKNHDSNNIKPIPPMAEIMDNNRFWRWKNTNKVFQYYFKNQSHPATYIANLLLSN